MAISVFNRRLWLSFQASWVSIRDVQRGWRGSQESTIGPCSSYGVPRMPRLNDGSICISLWRSRLPDEPPPLIAPSGLAIPLISIFQLGSRDAAPSGNSSSWEGLNTWNCTGSWRANFSSDLVTSVVLCLIANVPFRGKFKRRCLGLCGFQCHGCQLPVLSCPKPQTPRDSQARRFPAASVNRLRDAINYAHASGPNGRTFRE